MNAFMGVVLLGSTLAGGIFNRFTAGPTVLVCYQRHTYRVPAYLLHDALKAGATRGVCR